MNYPTYVWLAALIYILLLRYRVCKKENTRKAKAAERLRRFTECGAPQLAIRIKKTK